MEGGDRGDHHGDRGGSNALAHCVQCWPHASSERQHQSDHDGPPVVCVCVCVCVCV